jgi:hypothetical protein
MRIFRIAFLSLVAVGMVAGATAQLRAKQVANSNADPIPVCPFRTCPANPPSK